MMISKKKGLITQGLIPDWLDKIFLNSVTPLINFFSTNNINPNWITALGFFLNIIASCFIYYGKFFIGGILVGIAGIFDFIDGKVAAATQKITKFGGIFDSILDRYSDVVIYLAIILFYQQNEFDRTVFVTLLALVGSIMTSYIKAIGESHGFKFRFGALRRQERITLLCFGLLFNFMHQVVSDFFQYIAGLFTISIDSIVITPLSLVIYFLAFFTNFTSIQRFIELIRIVKRSEALHNN